MEIIEKFSYNNDCYKNNKNQVDSRYVNFQKVGPRGLMLHSVGCPQPSAEFLLIYGIDQTIPFLFTLPYKPMEKYISVYLGIIEDGTPVGMLIILILALK